jgi:hypothetical protein
MLNAISLLQRLFFYRCDSQSLPSLSDFCLIQASSQIYHGTDALVVDLALLAISAIGDYPSPQFCARGIQTTVIQFAHRVERKRKITKNPKSVTPETARNPLAAADCGSDRESLSLLFGNLHDSVTLTPIIRILIEKS